MNIESKYLVAEITRNFIFALILIALITFFGVLLFTLIATESYGFAIATFGLILTGVILARVRIIQAMKLLEYVDYLLNKDNVK